VGELLLQALSSRHGGSLYRSLSRSHFMVVLFTKALRPSTEISPIVLRNFEELVRQ